MTGVFSVFAVGGNNEFLPIDRTETYLARALTRVATSTWTIIRPGDPGRARTPTPAVGFGYKPGGVQSAV
jgi:hypothetical protein